jgi:hypothetical protein
MENLFAKGPSRPKPDTEIIYEDEPDGVALEAQSGVDCVSLFQHDLGLFEPPTDHICIVDPKDARTIADYLNRWADWRDNVRL